MTGEPAKNFHGVGIGPLSKILAVKWNTNISIIIYFKFKAFLNCAFFLNRTGLNQVFSGTPCMLLAHALKPSKLEKCKESSQKYL